MVDYPTRTGETLSLSPRDGRPPPHRILGRLYLPPQQLAAITLDPELEREGDRLGLRVVLELAQHGYAVTAYDEASGLGALSDALSAAFILIDELKATLDAAPIIAPAAAP